MAYDAPASFSDWTLLRAFLSLVATRGLDQAAGQLGVSVATLKRRLARLEDTIDAKLYTGSQRTLVLTEEGEQLASVLSRVDTLLGGIKPVLAVPQQEERTPVSVLFMDVLFEMFLMPFYAKHIEMCRKYQFSTAAAEFLEGAKRSSSEITVTHFPNPHVDCRNLNVGVHQVAFGATQAYVDAYGLPNRSNLNRHHLALVSDFRLVHKLWIGLEDVMREVSSSVEMDSTAACRLLVNSGQHFGLVTQWSLSEDNVVCPDLPKVEMPVFLSYKKAFYAKPEGKLLVDLMAEEARDVFQPQAGWLDADRVAA